MASLAELEREQDMLDETTYADPDLHGPNADDVLALHDTDRDGAGITIPWGAIGKGATIANAVLSLGLTGYTVVTTVLKGRKEKTLSAHEKEQQRCAQDGVYALAYQNNAALATLNSMAKRTRETGEETLQKTRATLDRVNTVGRDVEGVMAQNAEIQAQLNRMEDADTAWRKLQQQGTQETPHAKPTPKTK